MEEVEQLATSADALLACCLCRCLLRDAVQLRCLHNCCQQCISTAASNGSSRTGIKCGSCGTVTQAGEDKRNYFVDHQVRRYLMIGESRVCGVCKGNGEHDKPALVWCPTCRHSLCGDCIAAHRQYFRQHVTQSLEELRSVEEVCLQPSTLACPVHKMPVDMACHNCEQAKCIRCWVECKAKKHEMHIVGEESFDSYIGKFVACISTMESELLLKLEILDKSKIILHNSKDARDRHLEHLNQTKRLIVDAVEMVHQEMVLSTKNAYDDLEAEYVAAAVAANRITADLWEARSYIRRLIEWNDKCEILNQQKIVRERLSVLSAELDSLSDRMTMTREVKIDTSLPEDLENVIRAWFGTPHLAFPGPWEVGLLEIRHLFS